MASAKAATDKVLSLFKSSFNISKICQKDLVVKHSRASGKGGQNVNKVNTKVEMRLSYYKVDWIPPQVSYLLENSPQSTTNKELVVKSDRFRSQTQNYNDCLNKLFDLINTVVVVPGETSSATKLRVNEHIQREKIRNMAQKQFLSSKKRERRDRS